MPNQMSPKLVDDCIDVIADYANVQLTKLQFEELMQDNPELKAQLIQFNSPSDTMDREDMINALSMKVIGKSWPTYGDGQSAFDAFVTEFVQGCSAKGYEIVCD